MAGATRVTLAGGIGLMLARGLIVLATIVALLGAPASVSAAGNELSAAQASPGSGSTTTVFSFKVKYDGKFPAISVTASVAGRALAMTRASGTASNGAWVASSTLPAGTWPVTFTASPERGNVPSLSGPTVKVAPAATPPPTATPTPKPAPVATPAPPLRSGTNTNSGSATTPAPAPVAPAPAPGESVTPDDGDESTPAGDETPDETEVGSDAKTGKDDASAGGEPDRDADGAPVGGSGSTVRADESPDGAPTVGSASSGLGEDSPASSDGLLTMVLFAGLSGVAAVALTGTALLLAGRRGARDDEPAVPVGAMAGPNSEASPASPAAGEILDRRTLRQARVRMTDDPIVAALGIGNEDDDRRRARRKAGQVGRGPGERPNVVRH